MLHQKNIHEFVVVNYEILPAEKSFLSASSVAALYGKSVFTTLAVYDSKPFHWEKHWLRLIAHAAKIGIDFSAFSENTVKNSLLEIIRANDLREARARLTFFDETPSRIWRDVSENKTSFSIQTADFRLISKYFRLTISPFAVNSKSPLANVKSGNYLENILALGLAKTNGFDEAVRLNERGEIVSAATANVFWTKNERIFTPELGAGCLAGTTRDFVCERFPVSEVKAGLTELNEADEIFLTSAGIGIAPVSEFQNRKLSAESRELIREILRAFDKLRVE